MATKKKADQESPAEAKTGTAAAKGQPKKSGKFPKSDKKRLPRKEKKAAAKAAAKAANRHG
jgi:hypothetical protein